MVNTEAFKGRLEQILAHYELSASAFAEAIGVQASGISHLLSGRNKPSLDFVLKVVHRFPEINLYWLLNGKGSFPPAPKGMATPEIRPEGIPPAAGSRSAIEKIVVFYRDGTFREYHPAENRDTD